MWNIFFHTTQDGAVSDEPDRDEGSEWGSEKAWGWSQVPIIVGSISVPEVVQVEEVEDKVEEVPWYIEEMEHGAKDPEGDVAMKVSIKE